MGVANGAPRPLYARGVKPVALGPETTASGSGNAGRAAVIVTVLVAISAAHYATDPGQIAWHVAYQDLCYAPILVAAYWFGAPGGIAAAVLAGAGTIVHFHESWHDNTPFIVSQYGQVIGFAIAGTVGGLLASAERRATRRAQRAAASLQEANVELRTSHEQLRRADRLSSLGQMAAGLAHEVRNPLAGVKGALEIITSRVTGGTPEAEFAGVASREIARLDDLISEFLAYARPHDPERREIDVFDVLARVVSLTAGEAERGGAEIEVARTPAPIVSIDSEQMAQVFFNIVLNAIQATPPGGHVQITAGADSGMLAVSVRDEGPGISADDLPKVFDPFFSTRKTGTGLGLSISQRIVQSHHGRIEIVQPGRGTIVRVLLALPPGAAAAPKST